MALKVMTILGTRPEIIRLSRTLDRLDRFTNHVLVHTGQNYDAALNEVFFDDLALRSPDHFLNCARDTLGATLGGILTESARILEAERPDAVLVLGDTNSALSAIIARRMKIPVYHMEAGNRSFDRNVPEETNRKIVDHIADFNLVYTEHARRHLLAEGLPHRRIYLTGSPMREVLDHYRPHIESSDVLKRLGLAARGYVIASLHREENVDNSSRLSELLSAIEQIAEKFDKIVVVSTHPRTRRKLEALGGVQHDERVRLLKPFGFHDYNRLQKDCWCAVSDSGTIAEEAAILGFPAVSPRESIERPEALDTGTIIVTGVDAAAIVRGVHAITNLRHGGAEQGGSSAVSPFDYTITNTSERVVNLILGTAGLSNQWDGIRLNDLA
jgi:UDP-N-acetyl-L-fucosamine synthase